MTAHVSVQEAGAVPVAPTEELPSEEVLRAVDDLMAICRPAGLFLIKMKVGVTRETVNGIGVGRFEEHIEVCHNRSSDRDEYFKAAHALMAIEAMPGGLAYLKEITLPLDELYALRRGTDDPFRGALWEFDDAQTIDEAEVALRKIDAIAPRTLVSTLAFAIHARANLASYTYNVSDPGIAYLLDKIAGGLRNAVHEQNKFNIVRPLVTDEDPIIEDIATVMKTGESEPIKYALADRAPTSMRGAIAALKLALAEHHRHHVSWPPRSCPQPYDQLIAAMIKGALGVMEAAEADREEA